MARLLAEGGRPVLLVEGVSSSRPAVADRLESAVWLHVPAALRLARGIERDGAGSAADRAPEEADHGPPRHPYPAAKYRLKTERIAAAVADAAERGGGSGPLALRQVLLLIAFSYLIGNGDLHAKNFSATRSADGVWTASPAYDLVSTQPYLGWRDPTALDFYGRANRLDRRHLVDSGARLGLPARAVTRMLDQLVERAAGWPDRVHRIGLDDRVGELLSALLRRRIDELAG